MCLEGRRMIAVLKQDAAKCGSDDAFTNIAACPDKHYVIDHSDIRESFDVCFLKLVAILAVCGFEGKSYDHRDHCYASEDAHRQGVII